MCSAHRALYTAGHRAEGRKLPTRCESRLLPWVLPLDEEPSLHSACFRLSTPELRTALGPGLLKTMSPEHLQASM
jgi:hypothetical protein